MKKLLHLSVTAVLVLLPFVIKATNNKNEFGVYKTKEDYLSNKLTVIDKMQESDNYNLGVLKIKDKDNKEQKVNCLKEKYWGFRYIDGYDYMLVDGFYAKIVIVGRINLLISPKAGFTINENGDYAFTPTPEGKINYYFTKDLDPNKVQPFEKLITDEKGFLKSYQSDKDNYGEFIQKQITYLKRYNAIVPKKKTGSKK